MVAKPKAIKAELQRRKHHRTTAGSVRGSASDGGGHGNWLWPLPELRFWGISLTFSSAALLRASSASPSGVASGSSCGGSLEKTRLGASALLVRNCDSKAAAITACETTTGHTRKPRNGVAPGDPHEQDYRPEVEDKKARRGASARPCGLRGQTARHACRRGRPNRRVVVRIPQTREIQIVEDQALS